MSDLYLSEVASRTPLLAETEVLVLGGGPAGIAAAASAAAAGREVLLVERYGFLGGMGTAAGVTNFCGLHANVHGELKRVVHGVADELLQRIAALGGLNEPHAIFGRRSPRPTTARPTSARPTSCCWRAAWAAVPCAGRRRGDARCRSHRCAAGGNPLGPRAIRARLFIDASGDGDLADWAGAPWDKGDAQGELLYPTLMFRVAGVDDARAGEAWREVGPRMAEAQRSADAIASRARVRSCGR